MHLCVVGDVGGGVIRLMPIMFLVTKCMSRLSNITFASSFKYSCWALRAEGLARDEDDPSAEEEEEEEEEEVVVESEGFPEGDERLATFDATFDTKRVNMLRRD